MRSSGSTSIPGFDSMVARIKCWGLVDRRAPRAVCQNGQSWRWGYDSGVVRWRAWRKTPRSSSLRNGEGYRTSQQPRHGVCDSLKLHTSSSLLALKVLEGPWALSYVITESMSLNYAIASCLVFGVWCLAPEWDGRDSPGCKV